MVKISGKIRPGEAIKELKDLLIVQNRQSMIQVDFEDLFFISRIFILWANVGNKNFGNHGLISPLKEVLSFSQHYCTALDLHLESNSVSNITFFSSRSGAQLKSIKTHLDRMLLIQDEVIRIGEVAGSH